MKYISFSFKFREVDENLWNNLLLRAKLILVWGQIWPAGHGLEHAAVTVTLS